MLSQLSIITESTESTVGTELLKVLSIIRL